jgi:hypothetical protein
MASDHGTVAHLLNPNYKDDVRRWLAEDCPSLDYGGFVVGDKPTEAKLLGKSPVSEAYNLHVQYRVITTFGKGPSCPMNYSWDIAKVH